MLRKYNIQYGKNRKIILMKVDCTVRVKKEEISNDCIYYKDKLLLVSYSIISQALDTSNIDLNNFMCL